MAEVVEFTLHVRPGHYEQVAEIYSEFAHDYLELNPSLISVLVVGDPGQGIVRGIGVFNTASDAAAVNSDQIFANFNDQIAPLISGNPDRVLLDLLHAWSKV